MIFLSLILVIVAAVTLVLGVFQDGLELIYVSIGTCVAAMAVLGIGVLLRKRDAASSAPASYGDNETATAARGTSSSAVSRAPVTPPDADEKVEVPREADTVIVPESDADQAAEVSGGDEAAAPAKKAVVRKVSAEPTIEGDDASADAAAEDAPAARSNAGAGGPAAAGAAAVAGATAARRARATGGAAGGRVNVQRDEGDAAEEPDIAAAAAGSDGVADAAAPVSKKATRKKATRKKATAKKATTKKATKKATAKKASKKATKKAATTTVAADEPIATPPVTEATAGATGSSAAAAATPPAKKATKKATAKKATAKKATKKTTAKKATAKKATKKATAKKATKKATAAPTTGGSLDTVKGLGPAKRDALLARFGSESAVAAASVEDISAIRGVSATLARAIKDELS